MIETYQESGKKEYIEASITIDGTTIASVGLRLKGNSTLSGLGGGFDVGNRGEIPEGANPRFGQVPADGNTDGNQTDGTQAPAEQPENRGGRAGGFGGDLSFDDPTSLPWLIKFDAFVDGQHYQGYTEIAVRPATSGETSLSEALALSLIELGGEPSQQASYSSFQINDGEAQLRLLVEVPGDQYAAETFEHDGVLYKALSTGSFTYRGEDPLAYADDFEQITRVNQQDLKPVINLLKWVDEASDEEFAAELDEYVDVESLASYSALQELVNNFDDMSGPGKNYYLWYDLETEKFTVVSWDLNLAFGGMGGGFGAGPGGAEGFDPSQIPGAGTEGGGVGPGQFPGSQQPNDTDEGESPQPPQDGQAELPELPGGGQFDPAQLPGGSQFDPSQFPDFDGAEDIVPGGRQFAGGGGGRGGSQLKERFLANAEFQALYDEAYAQLQAELFDSGQAQAELERLSAIVSDSGLVDSETVDTEVTALAAMLDNPSATSAP
jgi:spore coat protein CotH